MATEKELRALLATLLLMAFAGCDCTSIDTCAHGCQRNGGRMASYTPQGGCVCTEGKP